MLKSNLPLSATDSGSKPHSHSVLIHEVDNENASLGCIQLTKLSFKISFFWVARRRHLLLEDLEPPRELLEPGVQRADRFVQDCNSEGSIEGDNTDLLAYVIPREGGRRSKGWRLP